MEAVLGKVWAVLLFLSIVLLSALGEYICGRILLPAMGLRAPGYWTWFWLTAFASIFGFAANFLVGVIRD